MERNHQSVIQAAEVRVQTTIAKTKKHADKAIRQPMVATLEAGDKAPLSLQTAEVITTGEERRKRPNFTLMTMLSVAVVDDLGIVLSTV